MLNQNFFCKPAFGNFNTISCTLNRGNPRVIKPDKFIQVNDYIYRGGDLLEPEKVRFIKRIGVKTIISMDGLKEEQEKQFLRKFPWEKENKIIRINPDNTEQVQEAIKLLGKPEEGKFYVQCRRGGGRTGLLIALHRIQNEKWSLEEARKEMYSLGGEDRASFDNRFRSFIDRCLQKPDNQDRARERTAACLYLMS